MNPVDVELHLFAIGKSLDGKGKKPSEEQHNQIVSFLDSEIAAHPEDVNLRATLDSVMTMWEATQNFTPPTGSVGALNPDSWFEENGGGKKFVPHLCAKDYLRVFPHVITEYVSGTGTPSQFLGNRWAKDAEGIIKSQLEQYGAITPRQISEAVAAICNLTRITDPDKMVLPLDLIMPLPDHVIPINDGLFDMRNKAVKPHSPEYFYTESLPRKYINGASPEIFLKFLDVVFTGDPDAKIKKTQIFESIAWTLMRNYSIQGTVIFYGQGGEGKSIIHDAMANLLVHVSTITLAELENDKFKRAELYGSWANLISESTTEIITSEWFKRLTDGTQITVDRKNGHPFKMRSHAKMVIDTNELPVKENELRAFYRRVIAIIDFPNMLETLLTPEQINDYVTKLKDPDELDRFFSFVVDNYYGPLVQRMKFTGHLSIADAEKKWQERSNPGMTFLQMKQEKGLVFTDIEDAKVELLRRGIETRMYTAHEKDGGSEYLVTVKPVLIKEAIEWAITQGFPAKTINASTMGHAITQIGYQNVTADKKLSDNTKIKAWRDICILPFDDDESRKSRIDENPSGLQKTPQEILGEPKSLGSTPIPAHAWARAQEEAYRKVSGTKSGSSLDNTASNSVPADHGRSGTEPGLPARTNAGKPAETPVPNAIPDKNSITLDQGKDIIGQLLNLGYHVSPGDSGPSINGEMYKIAVTKPADAENHDRLLRQLLAAGFQLANTGAIGPLIFMAPLRMDAE